MMKTLISTLAIFALVQTANAQDLILSTEYGVLYHTNTTDALPYMGLSASIIDNPNAYTSIGLRYVHGHYDDDYIAIPVTFRASAASFQFIGGFTGLYDSKPYGSFVFGAGYVYRTSIIELVMTISPDNELSRLNSVGLGVRFNL